MVRRSRYPRRRRAGRKYGVMRKRRTGFRRTVLAKKVHWFKEMTQELSLVAPSASNGSGIMTWRIQDLLNYGNFQNLFDLYKITAVKVKIVPRFNVSNAIDPNLNVGPQGGNLPVLYVAPNRDPYVPAPTSIADIINDDGCRIIRLTKPVNLFLKAPKAKITTQGTAGGEQVPLQFNVGSKWQPWLTTGGNGQTIDQSMTEHHGFRWVINNQSAVDYVLDCYATLYFGMKEQD